MTEPELGSGALREALEKAMDALERIRASQRIVGVLVVQDMEGAIRSGRAALSLSSPIEHEPHSADFLRGYNEGCKDGAENTLREIIARNTERKAQASVGRRIEVCDLYAKEICEHLGLPYKWPDSRFEWLRGTLEIVYDKGAADKGKYPNCTQREAEERAGGKKS